MLDLKNWKLTVGLGLLASLMNDVFYGLTKYLIGIPYDLTYYYSNWLVPQNTLPELGLHRLARVFMDDGASHLRKNHPDCFTPYSWKKHAKHGASMLQE